MPCDLPTCGTLTCATRLFDEERLLNWTIFTQPIHIYYHLWEICTLLSMDKKENDHLVKLVDL